MKNSVNLLPWKCRRMQAIRLRVLQWSAPCAIAAAAVGLLGAAEWSRYRTAEARLEHLERDHAPVAAMGEQIKKQQAKVEEVSQRAARVAGLDNPRPALTLLGLVSQSARDCQGKLHVESLSVQPCGESAKKSDKAAAKPESGATAVVAIQGIATDNLAVSQFVLALHRSKAFQRVDLKSTQEQPLGGARVCSYLIECGY